MALRMYIFLENYAFKAWPLAMLLLLIALVFVWRKTKSKTYTLFFACFAYYILFALDKVFFPLPISGSYADNLQVNNARFIDNLNLIPFSFGRGTFRSTVETLVLNVLLTIPFGFGINFLMHIRARHFLWIAPALGIILEATQLAISFLLGFIYRVIDINDVLMNMLGVWIGYALFCVFIGLYIGIFRVVNIRPFGIFGYIYELGLRGNSGE
jgi:glycopeptide antibiotics resistance protein